MISLVPHGGLCNRMRAMDSAIALSKESNNPLTVYWIKDGGCNCGFHDLFEPIPASIATVKDMSIRPVLFYEPQKLKIPPIIFLYRRLQHTKFDKVFFHMEVNTLYNQRYRFEELKNYKDILIEAHVRFFSTEEKPWYKLFKPLQHIQAKINDITRHFSKDTIGVHIRRTDNKKSIENSPLELFIYVMKKELEFVPETSFFVASDSESVKSELIKIFGDKIILSGDEGGGRNTQEGMSNAVIDLYTLSATKKVLGSFWSSFSHTASHISDIEEVTVTKEMLLSKYKEDGNLM